VYSGAFVICCCAVYYQAGPGGNYGGGGGSINQSMSCSSSGPANGGTGAVRIVWPGSTRQFPSTSVGLP
jgi:hypothetical protein